MDQDLDEPQASEVISITSSQLPLSCPRPTTPLWNNHPKVYLPIEEKGQITCPYCSITYLLVDSH